MRHLITLELMSHENTLQSVKQLPGLQGLDIDKEYGLVLISRKRNLYTIRVTGPVAAEALIAMQPKIKGIHAEVRISTTKPEP